MVKIVVIQEIIAILYGVNVALSIKCLVLQNAALLENIALIQAVRFVVKKDSIA